MINLSKKYIYSLSALMLAWMALSSCSSDNAEPAPLTIPEEELTDPVLVSFNIMLAAPGGSGSRATDNFTDSELSESPALPNELINNWLVAFVRGNSVVAVVEGKPGGGGTSGASGVWNDKVTLELPRGTYSALAFANMDLDYIKGWLDDLAPAADWKKLLFEDSMTSKDSSLIPMSGFMENFTVRGTVNEEFAIEVVRMKAKIEYSIKNLSTEKIDLQSFSITPVYDGPVYLFPSYSKRPLPDTAEPENPPLFPAADDVNVALYTTHTELAPTGFILEPGAEETKRGNFYIKESIATGNHPTNRFHIGLRLKRGEGAAEDVTYALADDALKYIWRNDHILFPIVISDYVPEFEVLDYPPIGGYPVSVNAENNEYYARFSSSGAFDISARLRDSRGRTVAVKPYDGSGTQTNYVRYIGSEPENFQLTYEPTLATWQGNFPQGTDHRILLRFEFKIGTLVYHRTLHLISS